MFAFPLSFVLAVAYAIATPTDDGDYWESEDPAYEIVPEEVNSEGKS